jgi:predicted ribonuclease YlaK
MDVKPANNITYSKKSQILKQLEALLEEKVFNKQIKAKETMKHFVNCDNMEDEIYCGETVIVTKETNIRLNEKDIFLFQDYYGDRFISRCKLLSSGFYLIENNPTVNNQFFGFDEIQIVGKVVAIASH